jgi:flagella synthesis protein FlgN
LKSLVSASDRLTATLRAEAETLQLFQSLLDAEQQAILDSNIEALEKLTQSKLELIEHLNCHAAERQHHIIALGIHADRAGIQQWADTAGQSAKDAWAALLKAAEAAQQANQVNGALIQTHLQHNQQALSALLAAANQASLYGPDGQKKNAPNGTSTGRGIIGKA